MTTQVPSRVQGQSGFEAAVNPCRHWTGDGKTGKADCANGWTALFIKVRGALLDKLGLVEDDDMPLKLAQENPTLLKALVEAKSDAPPCLDAAGIQKVRAFVRVHAEGALRAADASRRRATGLDRRRAPFRVDCVSTTGFGARRAGERGGPRYGAMATDKRTSALLSTRPPAGRVAAAGLFEYPLRVN